MIPWKDFLWSLSPCGSREGEKKKGMLHALFEWSPFHNEVVVWIQSKGVKKKNILALVDNKRALLQTVKSVTQSCTTVVTVALFIWKIHMYAFENRQLSFPDTERYLRKQYCIWKFKSLNSALYFRWQIVVRRCDSLCCPRLEGRSGLPWDSWVSRAERYYFHANSMSSCATSKRSQVFIL